MDVRGKRDVPSIFFLFLIVVNKYPFLCIWSFVLAIGLSL